MTKKKGLIIGLIACLFLFGGYLLCRYPLLPLHGMIQWPRLMLAAGLLSMGILAIRRKPIAMLMPGAGYLISFFLAVLFQSDGVDAGGGSTNTLWRIWIMSYLAFLLLAPLFDTLLLRCLKKQTK